MQGKIEMRRELVVLTEILQNAINVVQAACKERGQHSRLNFLLHDLPCKAIPRDCSRFT